jgi:integrase
MPRKNDDPHHSRPPLGVRLWCDIEERTNRAKPFRSRVRWRDPATGSVRSLSDSFESRRKAEDWLKDMRRKVAAGEDLDSPATASRQLQPPIGVTLWCDIEERGDRATPYRSRVRWRDTVTGNVRSASEAFEELEEAEGWLDRLREAAADGLDPTIALMNLADYGERNMQLALRGLQTKTTDPYRAGWNKRVVPSLGHLPVRMISYGAVDRAIVGWIDDGGGRSTVKNSLAILVRVMEQAVRDGLIDRNPARIYGWQDEFKLTEDELDDPRGLALPDWATLVRLADALVARSTGQHRVWGDVVLFAGVTGARIGEVSGCRVRDIDTSDWIWNVRRQTTPSPGGLIDKATKGKRARDVPLIVEIRELIQRRIDMTDGDPDARLFTGPRGGRITTAILRDATHWDEVVTKLGFEQLRRHDLRHTALTWLADAGVQPHALRKMAGHGSLTTTQRYLHPSRRSVTDAGDKLSRHLSAATGAHLRAV